MVAPCVFPTRQGTQVFLHDLCSALSHAGHQVHLVTYGDTEFEFFPNYHIHRIMTLPMGRRSGPNILKFPAALLLAQKTQQVVEDFQCDVLHANTLEGLAIGVLSKRLTRKPLVYHAHNFLEPELPTYFSNLVVSRWAATMGRFLDQNLPPFADAAIVFDGDQKKSLEDLGVRSDRLFVIPAGLQLSALNDECEEELRELRARLPAARWFLYTGNPDGYQNLTLLYEAFKRAQKRNTFMRLLVASHHPYSAFLPELQKCGVEGVVHFERYFDKRKLAALLRFADVGVCPRKIYGGAPIKVINYRAFGLPVLACSAVSKGMVNDNTGLVVPPGVDEFCEGLWRLSDYSKSESQPSSLEISTQVSAYERVYARVAHKRATSP